MKCKDCRYCEKDETEYYCSNTIGSNLLLFNEWLDLEVCPLGVMNDGGD